MLVLVDGVRLNDAQSGHHNGDIPVPLDAVERIEVLHGPGLVAVRRGRVRRHGQRDHAAHVAPPALVGAGRQLRRYGGRARPVGLRARRSARQMSRRPSIDRPDSCTTATSRPPSSGRARRSATAATSRCRYLWKEFGANNFYGGNAPSREWTNQTLVAADHRLGAAARLERRLRRVVPHARRSSSSSISSIPRCRTTGIVRTPCSDA